MAAPCNTSQQIREAESGAPPASALGGPKLVALARLVSGSTVSAAARAAGVDRVTVWRWLNNDALFISELNRFRRELNESTAAALRILGRRSVRVLGRLLSERGSAAKGADVRLRAALGVLRLVAAEARADAPVDVEDVLIRMSLRDRRRFVMGAMARHSRPAPEPEGPEGGGELSLEGDEAPGSEDEGHE